MCDTCTLPKKLILNNGGPGPIVAGAVEEINAGKDAKRRCGCLRTSEKLKKILGSFPSTGPPTMCDSIVGQKFDKASGYNYGHISKNVMQPVIADDRCCMQRANVVTRPSSRSWQVITELVALVQLSVTATALALYYLIYCYMHLIYFTLRSAMYFHNADGPMKVTIAVVTVTSIVIGLHILARMQRVIAIIY